MFPLTRRADYAVRIMVELGDKADRQRIPATEVAQSAGIPLAFLRKIVVDLVKFDLVRTYSGPNGGLTLAQPVESINLAHILKAIEGPICLNTCLVRPKECPRDHVCPVHGFLGRLQANIIQQLQEATLDRLVAEKRELEHHHHTGRISNDSMVLL
jgi:Rrf2 family transcriptional regulator, iron-sulfur cluster assembly transcription factor